MLFVSSFTYLSSQISGKVIDIKQNPIVGSVIQLKNRFDSSLLTSFCDVNSGNFILKSKLMDGYYIEIKAIGYETKVKIIDSISVKNGFINFGEIILQKTKLLKEVQINSSKPLVEKKNEKLIVNVENSMLSNQGSAFDVLAKSPQVSIRNEESISINGKPGVVIMINGRRQYLSGADLMNYLKTIPSLSVEKIEITSNPSAANDAEGSGGIIDIKLKKDKRHGWTGSTQGNLGHGVLPKVGAGFGLNYRSVKLENYLNYNYGYREGLNDLRLYRQFYLNENKTGAYNQNNYLVVPSIFHSINTGINYHLNPRITLGLQASGTLSFSNPVGNNISYIEDSNSTRQSYFKTHTYSVTKQPFGSVNSFLSYKIDSLKSVQIDMDLSKYNFQSQQKILTSYFDLNNSTINPDLNTDGNVKGQMEIKSIKFDYKTKTRNQKFDIEIGSKLSQVSADNELKYYDISNLTPVFDTSLSNHFIYKEQITAAYTTLLGSLSKFNYKIGLRLENTHINGHQLINNERFTKDYTNLFPSASLTYNLSDKIIITYDFSRRLDRPSYEQLNPFKLILDPSTFKAGNPALNPQYTWNSELSLLLFQKFVFSAGYSNTEDNILEVVAPHPNLEKVTIQTDINSSNLRQFFLNASLPLKYKSWYSSQTNISLWNAKYRANFANTEIDRGNTVIHLVSQHQATLLKKWKFEFGLNYLSPQTYGYFDFEFMWGLDLGISTKVFRQNGNLKLTATDIFWTNRPRASTNYNNYNEYFNIYRESRQIVLSFNYRFGKKTVEQIRKRESGIEEEKKRAQRA